ncbi:MAG: hypothetical protein M1838_000982 [Thelocarpon superellum]|nr:MAG: hypothetical protein M1838_000982 [Thelocarpon superellum]
MLSIRALTRSVARQGRRVSTPVVHSRIARPSLLQTSWIKAPTAMATAVPRLSAAFSTSRIRWEKQGEVDVELVAKIESELQMEKEMRDSDEVPVSVKDYLENGPFEIEDVSGQEEVVLTRNFGDEQIRVVFSVADLNTFDADADRYDERALEDEEELEGEALTDESTQSGGAQSKSAINAGRTSDDNIAVAPEDEISPANPSSSGANASDSAADESSLDEPSPSFPARVNVTITKPGQGALQIETIAQDGMVVIENVSYHANAALADESTAEAAFARKSAYSGPPFGNLDEDLQVLLERYLDERGVNTALALFVPDYIDYKEQREYLQWLSNVQSFVES